MSAATLSDWYCESCNEWCEERGDDAHTGHDVVVADRTSELIKVARAWHKARDKERSLAADLYRLIQVAHQNGVPETQIAAAASIDRMTVRRALGKR